jgi:hypothetical protein
MGHSNIKDQTTADAAAGAAPADGGTTVIGPEAEAGPRELVQAGLNKGRALLRVYLHSRKVRAAAKALAQALAESRAASSWPGDRLPVGEEMSVQVEKLTHRLNLETEAHCRLEALFRSADLGRPAAV